MKRILSLLLVICTLATLLPGVASAADTMTDLQRALVETALTYYYKGNSVQYDSYYIGKGSRYLSGILRQTNNREPEEASIDDIYYTVCSAFPHDAFFSTFGQHIVNEERQAQIAHLTHQFSQYTKGMNLTEDQLAYELAIENVTASFTAFGEVWDDTDGAVNPGNMVIGYWGPVKDENGKDTDVFTCANVTIDEVQAMLQPGDIIAAHPKAIDEDGTADESGGHAMMFLGDIFGDGKDYVIHSGGTKYNNEDATDTMVDLDGNLLTGHDRLEAPASWARYSVSGTSKQNFNRNGSVCVAPYEYLLGSGKSYDVTNAYDFTILRPINAISADDLTDSAKFRLHHPALGIYKTADVKPYRDVKVGDTITYTIRIDNNTRDTVNMYDIGEGKRNTLGGTSYGATKGWGAVVKATSRNKTYTDLVLTETLPAGTTFVSSTVTPTQSGSTLTWNVPSVSAGNTTSISYTVKVTGGSQIVSPKGTITSKTSGQAGSLVTKELTHEVVAQQLAASKASAITASSVTASTAAVRSGTDVAADVYAAMGYKVDIPHGQELAKLLMRENGMVKDDNANRTDFVLAEASELESNEAKTLRNMIVPGFVGGARLLTKDENGLRTNENRLRVLRQDFLQPGDVLVYLNTRNENGARVRRTEITSEAAYVYLGNDNFAHYVDGVFTVTNDPIITYWGTSSTVGVLGDENGSNTPPDPDSYGSRKYSYSKIFHQAFMQDLFVVMRPSRVGLTAQTATSSAKAVEVVSSGVSTYYTDLKTAVAAAADGDTIVLHEDLTLSSTIYLQKSLTIDFNGFTAKSTATTSKDTFNILDGADGTEKSYVLKNGTVDGVIYVGNSCSVRVENMKLLGRDWEYLSGSITRYGSAICKSSGSKLTLSNVAICSASATHIPLQQGNDIVPYKNVTVENDVRVMIPDGTTWDYSSLQLGDGVKAYTTTKLRSLDGIQDYTVSGVGYKTVTFTATPDVVNETTGETYASLSEAVRAAADGATLRLLRDVDASDIDEVAQNFGDYGGVTMRAKYLVYTSKNLTIDLDGHTILDELMGAGTFLFRDDGKTSNGLSVATMKNGTIRSAKPCFNTGSITNLENMTVISGNYAVFMSASGNSKQVVNVYGGTIMGGMFGGEDGTALFAQVGTVNLYNDAKVFANVQAPLVVGNDTYTGTVNVESATLGAVLYTYNAVGSADVVNGSVNVAEGSVQTAQRKAETVTMDGKTYTFVTDTYAVGDATAANGNKKYLTLDAALVDAAEGETVVLKKPMVLTGNLTVPAGVTLDLTEAAVTNSSGYSVLVYGTVTGAEIVGEPVYITLMDEGNYLGITRPKDMEGDVHPHTGMNGTYNLTVDSDISIDGSVECTYSKMFLLDLDTGEKTTITNSKFSLGAQSAKQMGEATTVVPVANTTSGKIYVGKTVELCVQDLAEAALEKVNWDDAASAATGRALTAMLNYGAAAQTYFGYNTDALANANTTKYNSNLNYDLTANRKDESALWGSKSELLYGTSCVLGETLQMKVYVRIPTGVEPETFTFVWKGSTTDMTLAELTKEESVGTDAAYYSFLIEDINLMDLDEVLEIRIHNTGKTLTAAEETLRSYLTRVAAVDDGMTELADAILTYALAMKELA